MKSILPQEISTWDYYLKKIPTYLREDESFVEHFKIWYDFLIGEASDNAGCIPVSDKLLSLINIFDDELLNNLNNLEGSGSDYLDKLGSIFNLKRKFSTEVNGTKKDFDLNNEEFLLLIRAHVIKNYCNGSLEQISEFYNKAKMLVYYHTQVSATTTASLLELDDTEYVYSQNVKDLFKAGMFTINSMGINVICDVYSLSGVLIWDNLNTFWDGGNWVL